MTISEEVSSSEITNLVVAKVPFIYVISHDEKRCITEIYHQTCLNKNGNKIRSMFIWSIVSGMVEYDDDFFEEAKRASGHWDNSWNPGTAISCIQTYEIPKDKKDTIKGSIFIMRDFHTALTPSIARQMKDLYDYFSTAKTSKTIIGIAGMLAHFQGAIKSGIEPSLEKQMAIVRWALPSREQIETQLRESFSVAKNISYTDDQYYGFSRALQGLTSVEIDSATMVCMATIGILDAKRLMREKKQIIMRSDILEYIESDQNMSDLGGVDNLKLYITNHANSHTEEALAFGVEPLKGIILVGIPGGGKSTAAKAIGNAWNIPTLRLDVGKVMSGLVGSSEQRMREVVQQAEAISPAVLWVDEIEKALSGTKSSNFSDGGTLSRVFGTLLTAMEEGLKGIVIIATANDISMLPPELIRRFSETFYVGLPTFEERKEIWTIHLKKKHRNPEDFNLVTLADKSDKFTGAEIQKSLKEAIATCFNDGKRPVTTEDIVESINSTKPIAIVMKDKIKETADWALERARFASSLGEAEVKPGSQKVKGANGKSMSMAELDKDLPELGAAKNPASPIKTPKKTRLNHIIDSEPKKKVDAQKETTTKGKDN